MDGGDGLHYRVLGPLEVVDGGRTLDIGRPKQRAALAVLLLECNRVVSLDRLIDLLWGSEPPARSVASLQVYVSNLRRVLEPDRAPRVPSTVLLTRPPGYLLRVRPEQLDATRFEAMVAEGRRLLAEGHPDPARRVLDEALGLWRGQVLADFGYEDFARPVAVRWEELRQAAVEDRIEAELALGSHVQAVGSLEALLTETPLRERLWAMLMVALYRCGRQAEALRAFSRARALLIDELGVEPGPVLVGLERDILNHAVTLEWRTARADAGAVPGVLATDRAEGAESALDNDALQPDQQAVRIPLVGRSEQLGVLTGAFDEANRGRGGVVLVTGEAGIGKTRLAEEFAARAEAAGAAVAWGSCPEGEAVPAFWPWLAVLRAVLARADPAMIRRALGAAAAALAELLPEAADLLGGSGPPPPRSDDPEAARFQLYEAVTATLAAVTGERPLVVILDDLHCADPASLSVYEYVAAHVQGVRLLLVGNYRPAEVTLDHPLLSTLATLARRANPERLALRGLSEAEVARFVTNASGIEPSQQLVKALHTRTEGNPFFVAELVKLLVSEGSLGRPAAVTGAQIPAGVRDVLRRRLGRLPEATNVLLRVASVVGMEFDLELLSTVTGQDDEPVLEGVEAALVTGILEEAGEQVGHYRFSHALMQQTLYAELSAMRRARLHARVGDVLVARRHGNDSLPGLAHHFYEAAAVVGAQKGIDYALAAAEVTQRALGYEDAERHLRRALDLAQTMPAGLDRDRRELATQEHLASLLTMVRGVHDPDAGRAWVRATELCANVGDHGRLLASLWGPFVPAFTGADFERARQLCDRMTDLWRSTGEDSVQVVEGLASGGVALVQGHLSGAYDTLERAHLLASSRPDLSLADVIYVDLPSIVQSYFGLASSLLGRQVEGRRLLAGAIGRTGGLGQPFSLAHALWMGAVTTACSGSAELAREWSAGLSAVAMEHGFVDFLVPARVIHGWASARLGGEQALEATVEEVLAGIGRGTRIWLPLFLGLLGQSFHLARCSDDAILAVDRGLAEIETTGVRFYEAELHRLHGELVLAREPSDTDSAMASFERAVVVAREQGATPYLLLAESARVRLLASA